MPTQPFDRAAEDLGNCINLGHVNVQVPDQRAATSFYVTGLGLTRDPYLMTGIDNMWVNCGVSQFHLFGGPAQVLRGTIGLVLPDLPQLLDRLAGVRGELAGTNFECRAARDHVEVTCPWGNRMRCHAPDRSRFGGTRLGLGYVEFDVPTGVAGRIAAFYREILGAPAIVGSDDVTFARVLVGDRQHLVFRETDPPPREYDGHHLQLYVADFSGPHRRLVELGLLTEESNPFQYRFLDIVDLNSRAVLFTIEHEIRSATHPMYARPLVNRNPAQTARHYQPGEDPFR